MKKGTSQFYDLRERIEAMIEQELNGKQIAARLNIDPATLYAGLKLLELSTKPKPTQPPVGASAPPPLVGTPCTDEQGRPMTRYPARWAFGALMQSSIVRSRRK